MTINRFGGGASGRSLPKPVADTDVGASMALPTDAADDAEPRRWRCASGMPYIVLTSSGGTTVDDATDAASLSRRLPAALRVSSLMTAGDASTIACASRSHRTHDDSADSDSTRHGTVVDASCRTSANAEGHSSVRALSADRTAATGDTDGGAAGVDGVDALRAPAPPPPAPAPAPPAPDAAALARNDASTAAVARTSASCSVMRATALRDVVESSMTNSRSPLITPNLGHRHTCVALTPQTRTNHPARMPQYVHNAEDTWVQRRRYNGATDTDDHFRTRRRDGSDDGQGEATPHRQTQRETHTMSYHYINRVVSVGGGSGRRGRGGDTHGQHPLGDMTRDRRGIDGPAGPGRRHGVVLRPQHTLTRLAHLARVQLHGRIDAVGLLAPTVHVHAPRVAPACGSVGGPGLVRASPVHFVTTAPISRTAPLIGGCRHGTPATACGPCRRTPK
jgi:hypothetical protein